MGYGRRVAGSRWRGSSRRRTAGGGRREQAAEGGQQAAGEAGEADICATTLERKSGCDFFVTAQGEFAMSELNVAFGILREFPLRFVHASVVSERLKLKRLHGSLDIGS